MHLVQRENGGDHEQKREAVQSEARDHAERGQRRARDDRSDHAREVELDRVERDRVGQVLFRDERRNERLIRGSAERLRAAGVNDSVRISQICDRSR